MRDAHTLIRHVHEADVSRARQSIREACAAASADWIPSDAIADALLDVFIERACATLDQHEIAMRLERLARTLRTRLNLSHLNAAN